MFYYTYKITFIDGRYYFGKHQTKDLNDDYAGSGNKVIALQEAGLPYKKVILKFYNNTKDLNDAEKSLIGDLWFSDPMCLNLSTGGDGGWDYVNKTYDKSQHKTQEFRNKMSKVVKELRQKSPEKYYILTDENRKKARAKIKESYPQGQFKGKTHSEETKRIIGEKNSLRQSGKGNSQYGTMWITDNKHNKKISKTSKIPTGWQKGRIIKVDKVQ